MNELTRYDEYESLPEKPTGFWNSVFGKILRWLLYIPVGSILIVLIEVLSIAFFIWLFQGDMRMFIIIGFLFGALFSLLPIGVMLYYFSIIFANQMICPSPKVGSVIFATLYILGSIRPFVLIFTSGGGAGVIVPAVLIKIIFFITAIVAFMQIYTEEN
jgi:hypothetical protein